MSVSAHHPARILVIEDSPSDTLLLRHALNHHADPYQMDVLRDGAEALGFVASQRESHNEPRPCVIVLDLHLPKHDGLAVLEAIKRAPTLEHIRVIALSSFASPRDEAEILALGVRLYREKPMELDRWVELAGEILAICRESSHAALV